MEFFRKKILRPVNRQLESILPAGVYIYIMKLLIPVFDHNRRGSHVKVSKDGNYYVAELASSKYYFCSAYNVGRYLFRDPKDHIGAQLVKKYSHGDITVEDGDIVIDVGANVGEFTMAVAERAAIIVAVEPDPRPFGCLIKNTKRFHNVFAVQAALGTEDGEAEIYLSSAHNDTSFIEPESWDRKDIVPVFTYGSILKRVGIEKVDFLKIEAEGYEPDILDAARPYLRFVRKIAIDGGPERHGQTTAEMCASILEKEGFSVTIRGHMVYGLNA